MLSRARAAALVAVLLTIGAVFPVAQVAAAEPAAPPTWDPRVLPVAQEVEKLRGLSFKHPVHVDFLSDGAFRERILDTADLSDDELADVRRSEAALRAIGLFPRDVDLLDAQRSLRAAGTLAFYDPRTKRATVRGKRLGVMARVTLAHELTHALQDQHFDLGAMLRNAERRHGSTALRALVEGDAVRVQNRYVESLSADAQEEYQRARSTAAGGALDEARSKGVPDSLVVFFQTPYTLGPSMLQLVQAARGDAAIDDLFREPPVDDAAFVTPVTLVDRSETREVLPPALREGEERDGRTDSFGSFALYLMLAAHGDPVATLPIVDGWGGDSMVSFRRDGASCLRANIAGRNAAAQAAIDDALARWVAAAPAGSAQLDHDAGLATLTACDPGPDAAAAPDRSFAAFTVAAVRNELLGALADQGLSTEAASCTANGVVADPVFRPVLDAAVADRDRIPDASALRRVQQRVVAIATACVRDA
jgi:hypothetical protein